MGRGSPPNKYLEWQKMARESALALPICDHGSTRAIEAVGRLLGIAYDLGKREAEERHLKEIGERNTSYEFRDERLAVPDAINIPEPPPFPAEF